MKVRLIVFAALLALTGVACSSKKDTPAAPASPTAGNAVAVVGNTFSPATLAASAGEVTFTWTGGGHNVVADDGSFTSGDPAPSGSFTHTFAAGTYKYYCAVHGGKGGVGMSGTITVA